MIRQTLFGSALDAAEQNCLTFLGVANNAFLMSFPFLPYENQLMLPE